VESWKASLLRAGVYPVRTEDEDSSQVRKSEGREGGREGRRE